MITLGERIRARIVDDVRHASPCACGDAEQRLKAALERAEHAERRLDEAIEWGAALLTAARKAFEADAKALLPNNPLLTQGRRSLRLSLEGEIQTDGPAQSWANRLKELHARGLSAGLIARELGASRATIGRHLDALGLHRSRAEAAALRARAGRCLGNTAPRVPSARTCVVCAAEFLGIGAARVCSAECRRKRNAALARERYQPSLPARSRSPGTAAFRAARELEIIRRVVEGGESTSAIARDLGVPHGVINRIVRDASDEGA